MYYLLPVFPGRSVGFARIGGVGLGNLLFPWARSLAFHCDNGGQLIWPTWTQFKIGPLLRGELDLRNYRTLFEPTAKYAVGYQKAILLSTKRQVSEGDALRMPQSAWRNRVIRFEGMKDGFAALNKWRMSITGELRSISAESDELAVCSRSTSIAVHIRMGDFKAETQADWKWGGTNCRTPLLWYLKVIREMRELLGAELPVEVYSDYNRDRFEELLREGNIEFHSPRSSIGDMFGLSRHRILIGSCSTFSLWAAFLGNPLCVWPEDMSLYGMSGSHVYVGPSGKIGELSRRIVLDALASGRRVD